MAGRRPVSRRGVIISLLCVVSPAVNALDGDDALPPPPDAQAIDRQAVFHLSLVVNYYDTGLVVPVTRRGAAARCGFHRRISSAPGCRGINSRRGR